MSPVQGYKKNLESNNLIQNVYRLSNITSIRVLRIQNT